MKRIIHFILVLIIIVLVFSYKNIYAYTYADGIKEIADAYYQKGLFIQYDTNRAGTFHPEDASIDNTKFMVCSVFVKNVYNELIGINTGSTSDLLTYAALMSKNNGVYNSDNTDIVLKYSSCCATKNEDNTYTPKKCGNNEDYGLNGGLSKRYEKYKNNISGSYSNFKKVYLNGEDVKVGDLVVYQWLRKDSNILKGHVIMIYDLIKDQNGNIIDAVTIESMGGNVQDGTELYENGTNSLANNQNYKKYNFRITEGGIHKDLLTNRYVKSILRSATDSNKVMQKVSVIRLIDTDTNINQNVTIKGFIDQNTPKISGNSSTRNTTINRSIQSAANTRLNYSKIDISKSHNKHFSSVKKGEKLTYKIVITNNSSSKYNNISVTEKISGGSIKECNPNCSISNGSITWNNISVNANKQKTLLYVVEVGNASTITSKGTLNNIPLIEITNNIVGVNYDTVINHYLKNKNNINYFLKNNTGSANFINGLYYYVTGDKMMFFKDNKKKYKTQDFITPENKVNTSSKLNKVVTKYHSVYKFNTKNKTSSPKMIAPLKYNLNYGDVIMYYSKENSNPYFLFLTDKVVFLSKGHIYIYTDNGKWDFTSYVDLSKTASEIEKSSNGTKISSTTTIDSLLRSLVSKRYYAVISPEFYVGG